MRVYEAFSTSERLVKEGRECEIEFGGRVICRVWVRPADPSLNADYRRELAELSVGLTRDGTLLEIDEDTDRELLWKVYARTVIVKWQWTDPADKKDQKLRFNEKNVLRIFRELPKFFEGIQRVARQWSQYRATHEEDAKGN
ncbi:MAG: hypothetical protein KAI41_01680 [Hyphomicrobiaceae bacterium]|nr:hypothetical protein [Hyphomicrobiaceae bacterium]